jgi:putative ABC transport system permease protein
MGTLLQDVRYGFRMLLKSPGFTTLGVVALALGIGANTAVFSVAIAFLRKPVSFPQSARIVLPLALPPDADPTLGWSPISPADYLDWKAGIRSFEHFAGWRWYGANLTGKGDPENIEGALVTANFFETLREMPAMGRPFSALEEQPGHDHEAILSYGLWQRRFGADPNLVGKTAQINGATYDIVGVMGNDFNFPTGVEIWRPMALKPEEQTLRSERYIMPFGRLKPGASAGQAAAEIRTIQAELQRRFPQTETGWTIRMLSIGVFVAGELSDQYCRLLVGAVLFVLLIACANVANLLFARGASRQKEIAVRRAMGAGRFRILRQLLTESVLLAFGGACVGLLLGEWGIRVIRYYMPPEIEKYLPMWKHVRLEADVFWYTVAITVFAGLISGLAPAFQSSRSDVYEELKEGGRGNTGGVSRQRLRSIFVVAEVALSLILLVGAGLMVKGVSALLVVNRNIDPRRILTMVVSLPESKYKTAPQKVAFFDQALRQFEAIPGVRTAAVARNVPFGEYENDDAVSIQGKAFRPGEYPQADTEVVSAGYFRMMNIPLRQGRFLEDTDGPDRPAVVVISESFARRCFKDENPIGKFIRTGTEDSKAPWARIVGVAGDIRYNILGSKELPPVYIPYQQSPENFCYLAMQTESDPSTFAGAVRSQLSKIDPDQPLSEVMPLQKVITNQLLGLSYVAVILGVLGIIALVLASVGVYGVMAYSVAERTHEIGVRMTLGAQRPDVLWLVMTRGLGLTSIGLAIGLPAAWLLARFLAGLFFGVSATDLATFSWITLLMCAITLLACFIPAQRSMRVDPMVALRYE